MTFSDRINEAKEIRDYTKVRQTLDADRVDEVYETRIMELESDLQNALDDLEAQTELTRKLKDKLEERKS